MLVRCAVVTLVMLVLAVDQAVLQDLDCVEYNGARDACEGKADGDYLPCFPECQNRNYITCSNGLLYVRNCANGWYGDELIPMMFDPVMNACVGETQYCPTEYDGMFTG